MNRRSSARRFAPWIAALAALATPPAASPAAAQLRPLQPVEWETLENGSSLLFRTGVGVYDRQRAGLAGTEGTLLEVGNFDAVWRSGRFALELGGTILRIFEDDSVFADPYGGVRSDAGPDRRDTGTYRVGTVIRLTPEGRDAIGILRFGTVLPTTDNEVGLDRDRTDFFALLGGGIHRGAFRVGAEAGLGIMGSHDASYEQNDVLMYSLTGAYRHRLLTPQVVLVGQRGGFDEWVPRGTENLAELRLGARTGGPVGVQALWVRGLTDFSPHSGLLLSIEVRR